MTIKQVIEIVDGLKANQYSTAQKVKWLNECDYSIYVGIIAKHELPEGMPTEYVAYTQDDMERELLAKAPHDVLYRHYLEMQIDLYNKELQNYNNSARLYNTALSEYSNWYTRNHMPLKKATHFKL